MVAQSACNSALMEDSSQVMSNRQDLHAAHFTGLFVLHNPKILFLHVTHVQPAVFCVFKCLSHLDMIRVTANLVLSCQHLVSFLMEGLKWG